MASSVYVAGVEGYTGKSAVALGLLEQLSRRVERVAVYRPVVRGDAATDYVLDLLVSHDFKIAGKKTVMLKPGKTAAPLTVTLVKGKTYTYICTVPGHAAAGMEATPFSRRPSSC